ncbi:hypothetical protein BCR36DRAFT_408212 [Piromyces finnis]|uniref:Uncharacterized protein n=1 Tax=Piromyces finnis TaxID=1754191 RepID=A0A1Y1VPC2_9FUNG|nr:hypothetical protein BCR36DRAFT_408212 [Piromyces finnis]|eukprot:ORX61265.1 hypothetical protein BCR36DRAFT_408212 [Piromyces finnis]
MLTDQEIKSLYDKEYKYFMENDSGTLGQWLSSKGTSFDCYIQFINETDSSIQRINDKIDFARNIFYAFLKPFQSPYFYWTLLLLIMYKFNARRPIIKLVLYHYTLRAIGDIIEQLGKLLPYYHAISRDGSCVSVCISAEHHPLKWFLTRQINSFFWYIGEIIGDWYPLLRTKAVTKNKNNLKLLYITCIIYNISKLAVPISQLYVSPSKLYMDKRFNNEFVTKYYNFYWVLQAIIAFTTFIYEWVIYKTLKKELFNKTRKTEEYGLMKKFRLISEFRIIISAMIALLSFPFLFVVSTINIYFHNNGKEEIDCSVEEFRAVVTSVQYIFIFIDQILLISSKNNGNNLLDMDHYFRGDKTSGDNYNTGILNSQDVNYI